MVSAFIATFVALVSHIMGGGDLPGAAGILIPLILSVPFSLALTVKKISIFRLSLSVAISQTMFHALFVLGTPMPPTSAERAALLDQHAHHAVTYPGLPETPVNLLHSGAAMWIWHIVAGIITVAYLHFGTQLAAHLKQLADGFFRFFRQLHWLFAVAFLPVPTVGLPRSAFADSPLTSQDVDFSVRRRGPPFALAA